VSHADDEAPTRRGEPEGMHNDAPEVLTVRRGSGRPPHTGHGGGASLGRSARPSSVASDRGGRGGSRGGRLSADAEPFGTPSQRSSDTAAGGLDRPSKSQPSKWVAAARADPPKPVHPPRIASLPRPPPSQLTDSDSEGNLGEATAPSNTSRRGRGGSGTKRGHNKPDHRRKDGAARKAASGMI
jgi:hypothetical protein